MTTNHGAGTVYAWNDPPQNATGMNRCMIEWNQQTYSPSSGSIENLPLSKLPYLIPHHTRIMYGEQIAMGGGNIWLLVSPQASCGWEKFTFWGNVNAIYKPTN